MRYNSSVSAQNYRSPNKNCSNLNSVEGDNHQKRWSKEPSQNFSNSKKRFKEINNDLNYLESRFSNFQKTLKELHQLPNKTGRQNYGGQTKRKIEDLQKTDRNKKQSIKYRIQKIGNITKKGEQVTIQNKIYKCKRFPASYFQNIGPLFSKKKQVKEPKKKVVEAPQKEETIQKLFQKTEQKNIHQQIPSCKRKRKQSNLTSRQFNTKILEKDYRLRPQTTRLNNKQIVKVKEINVPICDIQNSCTDSEQEQVFQSDELFPSWTEQQNQCLEPIHQNKQRNNRCLCCTNSENVSTLKQEQKKQKVFSRKKENMPPCRNKNIGERQQKMVGVIYTKKNKEMNADQQQKTITKGNIKNMSKTHGPRGFFRAKEKYQNRASQLKNRKQENKSPTLYNDTAQNCLIMRLTNRQTLNNSLNNNLIAIAQNQQNQMLSVIEGEEQILTMFMRKTISTKKESEHIEFENEQNSIKKRESNKIIKQTKMQEIKNVIQNQKYIQKRNDKNLSKMLYDQVTSIKLLGDQNLVTNKKLNQTKKKLIISKQIYSLDTNYQKKINQQQQKLQNLNQKGLEIQYLQKFQFDCNKENQWIASEENKDKENQQIQRQQQNNQPSKYQQQMKETILEQKNIQNESEKIEIDEADIRKNIDRRLVNKKQNNNQEENINISQERQLLTLTAKDEAKQEPPRNMVTFTGQALQSKPICNILPNFLTKQFLFQANFVLLRDYQFDKYFQFPDNNTLTSPINKPQQTILSQQSQQLPHNLQFISSQTKIIQKQNHGQNSQKYNYQYASEKQNQIQQLVKDQQSQGQVFKQRISEPSILSYADYDQILEIFDKKEKTSIVDIQKDQIIEDNAISADKKSSQILLSRKEDQTMHDHSLTSSILNLNQNEQKTLFEQKVGKSEKLRRSSIQENLQIFKESVIFVQIDKQDPQGCLNNQFTPKKPCQQKAHPQQSSQHSKNFIIETLSETHLDIESFNKNCNQKEVQARQTEESPHCLLFSEVNKFAVVPHQSDCQRLNPKKWRKFTILENSNDDQCSQQQNCKQNFSNEIEKQDCPLQSILKTDKSIQCEQIINQSTQNMAVNHDESQIFIDLSGGFGQNIRVSERKESVGSKKKQKNLWYCHQYDFTFAITTFKNPSMRSIYPEDKLQVNEELSRVNNEEIELKSKLVNSKKSKQSTNSTELQSNCFNTVQCNQSAQILKYIAPNLKNEQVIQSELSLANESKAGQFALQILGSISRLQPGYRAFIRRLQDYHRQRLWLCTNQFKQYSHQLFEEIPTMPKNKISSLLSNLSSSFSKLSSTTNILRLLTGCPILNINWKNISKLRKLKKHPNLYSFAIANNNQIYKIERCQQQQKFRLQAINIKNNSKKVLNEELVRNYFKEFFVACISPIYYLRFICIKTCQYLNHCFLVQFTVSASNRKKKHCVISLQGSTKYDSTTIYYQQTKNKYKQLGTGSPDFLSMRLLSGSYLMMFNLSAALHEQETTLYISSSCKIEIIKNGWVNNLQTYFDCGKHSLMKYEEIE